MTIRPNARSASDRVRVEWTRRIEAEYRSAALTQELGHRLIVLGAPEWLVRDSVRITTDELAHARLSAAVAKAAGNTEPPRIARESLSNRADPHEALEVVAARILLEGYCLGETIAVRLFAAMRKHCDIPVARRALDRILRDEVRHRDFGWNALEWLLAIDGSAMIRNAVEAELPRALARQRAGYAPAGIEKERSIPIEDRRWGLLAGATYASIVETTPRRDYAPRLRKLALRLPVEGP